MLNRPYRFIKAGVAIPLLVIGSACSTTSIIDLGDNHYGIATHNDVRETLAADQADMEARDYCKLKGLEMVPLKHAEQTDPALGEQFASYDLVFSCQKPGSAETTPDARTQEQDLEQLEQHDKKDQQLMDSL
jgi:hypothetical protein